MSHLTTISERVFQTSFMFSHFPGIPDPFEIHLFIMLLDFPISPSKGAREHLKPYSTQAHTSRDNINQERFVSRYQPLSVG